MKLIGILLLIFGIAAILVGGINYTKREKVVDLGPIQASTEKHETIPIPPVVGIVAIVAGGIILAAGSRTGA